MMQITEDTPPDMLAGAMDLTVHLPNGSAVKMSVERSTPMMDLLVQITTANHLQLSNHTLQALGMAPSSEHSDKILPFKPNTPIGALDTQHIKVLPKGRTLPAPKYTAPGHQPFESTFRLKVHLPRNQLYVTRVSRNVLLEDIMKKVCEEKNLDPVKYEFKHPGNLDQVLDPKLTLSDYQITEIYVVVKGTTNLSQAFSAADIMVLRKEEERKQMHTKTGGGVFNLIFKRGKSSMGSGSVSSENRSISPTHSDDSRSVTPPAVPAPTIVAPPKKEPPPERPKPPQRKRRPAPKPPQIEVAEVTNEIKTDQNSSEVSNEVTSNHSTQKSTDNGLTICHSRNSSDSSGYHEASILSDHCANTSLPRTRPKSAFVGDQVPLQSTSNLSNMSLHSRSTTSLVAGRKKKSAPPPPPVPVSPANSVVAHSEKPSSLVASQSDISAHEESSEVLETTLAPIINPVPKPRSRTKAPQALPRPRPSSESFISIEDYSLSGGSSRISSNEDLLKIVEEEIRDKLGISEDEFKTALNKNVVESVLKETLGDDVNNIPEETPTNKLEQSWQEVGPRRPVNDENESPKNSTKDVSPKVEQSNPLNSYSVESFPAHSTETGLKFHLGPTEEQYASIKDQDESLKLLRKSKPQNEDFSVEEILASLEVVNSFNPDKEQENNKSTNNLVQDNESTIIPPSTKIYSVQKSIIENIFSSDEFLKETKPPEIVGVIPKTPQEDKKYDSDTGSFGKKSRLWDSRTVLGHNDDPETISLNSKRSGETESSRNSIASALNALDDEISDLDEDMFTGSLSKASTRNRPEVFNQLFGMQGSTFDSDKNLHRNISVGSLRSVSSVPGLDGGIMKKWDNTEELNSTSLNYYGVRNKWVAGDASDTESIISSNLTPAQTPLESVPPFPLETSTPVRTPSEEKSIESTDSGIAQDTHPHGGKDKEEFGYHTPPPPPILDDIQPEKLLLANIDESLSSVNTAEEVPAKNIDSNNTVKERERELDISNKNTTKKESSTNLEVSVKSVKESVPNTKISSELTEASDVKKQEPTPSANIAKEVRPEPELGEIYWQYQLPSPPKAFRDSSPVHLILNETSSVTDFKDSVVTSPDLFEKLRSLEDHSEKDTLKSEGTSIASEEPLNMLSLEHLEKRKSLVYNRELATSLKLTDSIESSTKEIDNFRSSITNFQSTYDELNKNLVQQSQPRKPARTTTHHGTLPNFKITTYDVPKQNITVFEDDTISSNTHSTSTLTRSKLGRSMDNISYRKSLVDEPFESKEREYKFYRPQTTNLTETLSTVSRSESFSTDPRLPLRPVSRSKSTLTINKPQVSKTNEIVSISRSNSLFDVSGLQSLEVMKLIQNKLSTPTGSMEHIGYREKSQNLYVPQKTLPEEKNQEVEPPKVPEPQQVEEKPQPPSPEPVKKYYYRGPPAVNMTTWSERPKVPVSVKEDEDYTLGNANISSRLIVNTTNNNITSNNSIEVRHNGFGASVTSHLNSENRNVSVNVNGNDQISQAPTNNVVIKIGGTPSNNYAKNLDNQKFLAPTAYRKPFSNISRNGNTITTTQRPHSIALPSDFDISRVPVVRSVEFKKPFKDFHGSNTSITHINLGSDDFRSLNSNFDTSDSFVDKLRSTENLKSAERQDSESNKRVFRVSSFKPADSHSTPVVRGFKPADRDVNHRLSWNPSSTYNTLPAKPKVEKEYSTNQHVPFSQLTLKRTASSKMYATDQNYNEISKPALKQERSYVERNSHNSPSTTVVPQNKPKMTAVPPPPPQMPKVTLRKVSPQSQTSPVDARDMLLDSIRNFGGKKGLKGGKV